MDLESHQSFFHTKIIALMRGLRTYFCGLMFVALLVCIAFVLSEKTSEFLHLGANAFGVLLGMMCSSIFFKYQEIFKNGVNWSAKKLLRLGIILYGFHITLAELSDVGIGGILIACIVVVSIFTLALWFGKLLGIDQESSMLVGAGSAICGAAALLALESILKSNPTKGIITLSSIVFFGLVLMFVYPLLYSSGVIGGLDSDGMGVWMGISLHEVANVAGAAEMAKDWGDFSQSSANLAIILKMTRVILLVPFLLVVACFLRREEGAGVKGIGVPWFAFYFLGVIGINTWLGEFSSVRIFGGFALGEIASWGKMLCGVCIVCAMVALGLQMDFKKFIQTGRKSFVLAFLLCIVLVFGGYFLTLLFKGVLW